MDGAGAPSRDRLRRTGAAVNRGIRASGRGVRRATNAGASGQSGLARLLELHLLSSATDALIVTALASTIFFTVPTEAARGRVATSLLITMVPFLILAPVIGPLLDRVRRGRRYALATTMVVRAWLAWVMAGAIADGSAAFSLYPAAFGFLVCQKAYLVTRAAAVPRLLPPGTELVTVNSRMSAAGVIALVIGGPLGAGLTATAGPEWTLRLAFVIFAGATALALALPSTVDSEPDADASPDASPDASADPDPDPDQRDVRAGNPDSYDQTGNHDRTGSRADDRYRAGPDHPDPGRPHDGHPAPAALTADQSADAGTGRSPSDRFPRLPRRKNAAAMGAGAVLGLRANAAVRAFTGFLTLFLAFRLRTHPLPGITSATAITLVVVVAAVGGGLGTALGVIARRLRPVLVVSVLLVAITAVATWTAIQYGMASIVAVALAAGLGQSLAKVCLDALIQDDVPDAVRTSAFARSETVLQLAWVLGGGLGLALPLSGPWGMGVAAVLLAVAAVTTLRSLRALPRTTP